jgi:AraC-like DNA-binding protein
MPHRTKPQAWVRQISTLTEYAAATGLIPTRVNAQEANGFEASMMRLDLEKIRVRTGEASAAVTKKLIGAVPEGHAFSFATRPAPPPMIYGRNVPHGALYHFRPNELFQVTSASGVSWPWASIWTPYEELERCGGALAGRDVSPSRSDMAIIQAAGPARERLVRLVTDAGRVAAMRPEVAVSPPASRALSGAILEALVACLAQGERAPDRAAARRRHQIMARLELVLHEHAEEMLTLAQLCAAVGVAERTLHLVCQEFVGVGPMQYGRLVRLKLVRRALLAADPRTDRVSAIAMRYGFWALGRFAAAYREAFGETPSETLQGLAKR